MPHKISCAINSTPDTSSNSSTELGEKESWKLGFSLIQPNLATCSIGGTHNICRHSSEDSAPNPWRRFGPSQPGRVSSPPNHHPATTLQLVQCKADTWWAKGRKSARLEETHKEAELPGSTPWQYGPLAIVIHTPHHSAPMLQVNQVPYQIVIHTKRGWRRFVALGRTSQPMHRWEVNNKLTRSSPSMESLNNDDNKNRKEPVIPICRYVYIYIRSVYLYIYICVCMCVYICTEI